MHSPPKVRSWECSRDSACCPHDCLLHAVCHYILSVLPSRFVARLSVRGRAKNGTNVKQRAVKQKPTTNLALSRLCSSRTHTLLPVATHCILSCIWLRFCFSSAKCRLCSPWLSSFGVSSALTEPSHTGLSLAFSLALSLPPRFRLFPFTTSSVFCHACSLYYVVFFPPSECPVYLRLRVRFSLRYGLLPPVAFAA